MDDIKNMLSGDISVNGLKIHYSRTGGDKPAMVLLHGITDSGQCWPRLVQHLGDTFDMVMVDARGHGLSDAPDSGYGFQEQAADVVGVVESLKLDRPILVGHSMGAMTAIQAAATSPGLMRALILEDPPFQASEQISIEDSKTWYEESQKRINKEMGQTIAELIAERRDQSPNWSQDDLIPWAESKRLVSPNIADIAFSLNLPWRLLLGRITCPILLLTADPSAGAIVTSALADEAASLWIDGQIVYIQDAGHNIRRDQFEKYLAIVSDFLVEVSE